MKSEPESTLAQRIAHLLAQMTLEEKVAQMVQIPYFTVTREEALGWARNGAGSFLHVLGDDARELQKAALESRLGIPLLFGIDAIHGHALNDRATVFPSQLAAACSWNPALVEEMGRVTAREVATDGLHWTFSPVLCLARDPRWGRVNETFGEDAYLAGELGAAIIRGYQGERLDGEESIAACAKHYIGYGEALGARDACDTEMTFRKLREVFLPPFRRAVEAGVATVMTAYGSIDGTPFTASERSLKTILKDELGFDGFVVTDWDNVNSLVTRQFVAENLEDASLLAANAGNDMIMTTIGFYDCAIRLVRSGRLSERVIDAAVSNILRVKFRMGLFERPEKHGRPGCFGCAEHLEASLRLARESVTLLKNEGILPFGAGMRRLAVVGPNADDIRAQYGDWTYFSHPEPNPGHPPVRPYTTVLEGILSQAAAAGVEVCYHRGCGVLPDETDDLDGALEATSGCDAIVLIVGDVVEQTGEFKDRADLALSGRQEALFNRLTERGVPVVTVLVSSKPLCVSRLVEGSGAFLCAFNGGVLGGQAVAEVLFGRINPSGKLPVSFPRHSGQVPVYYNQLPGWHGGTYVDLPETPLFSFGEGLSYSRFVYSNLRLNEKTLSVRVLLKNAGDRAGAETVQVYLRDRVSSVLTPVKRLVAFQKISLAAGESREVECLLQREDFSLVLPSERRVVEPGEFTVFVGGSSRDGDLLSGTIHID